MKKVESENKIRYFKLSFIGLHSKLSKKKLTNLAKVCKLNWLLQMSNYDVLFQQKIHIKVNIFPRLSISFCVLAVMLVMSVKLTDMWQQEQMNTLARIRNLTYINTLCHSKMFQINVLKIVFLFQIPPTPSHFLYITLLKPILNKQKQCQYITSLFF